MKMKINRKSWHYQWRAYWFIRLGWKGIVEWRVTRIEYIGDMIMCTVFLPLLVLAKLLVRCGLWLIEKRPKRPAKTIEIKPPTYIEFEDCD